MCIRDRFLVLVTTSIYVINAKINLRPFTFSTHSLKSLIKSLRMATNVSTIDMNYTLNGSYFNQSADKHDHHSASDQLYSFLTYLSFHWSIGGFHGTLFFLQVSYMLYTYFSSKETFSEETTETVKKTQRDWKFKTFLIWFYFVSNSMILWMDIVAIVYCYGGFMRNCPLMSDDGAEVPYGLLFLGLGFVYLFVVFGIPVAASDILDRENISNADLHDALLKLMHREKPVVKWTANENDDDPVATEVIFLWFRCKKIHLCIKYSFRSNNTQLFVPLCLLYRSAKQQLALITYAALSC